MKRFWVGLAISLAVFATANAGLDTSTYVGYGIGQTIDDNGTSITYAPGNLAGLPNSGPFTGDLPVTLMDNSGGDIWNGGDSFMYIHDDDQLTGDFSATVRVISQTSAIDGRWGKAGIVAKSSLDRNSSTAMTQLAAGNGSQNDPPVANAAQDWNPVPARLSGRTQNDGQGGFENPIFLDIDEFMLEPNIDDSSHVANNFFQETQTIPVWLRLDYTQATNTFMAGIAADVNGSPQTRGDGTELWNWSDPKTDIPADGDGWYVGIGYSLHEDFAQHFTYPEWFHGVTFDNYSIVPDATGGPDGDFDNDGVYDCSDINSLTSEIAGGNNNADFDLTGDGQVNIADRDAWLAEAGAVNNASGNPYRLGDANLDGSADVSDFNVWNLAKFTSRAEYCAGDFNVDGFVDVSDFNIWNINKFTSSDSTSVVPEPAALLWLLPMGFFAFRRKLRRG